MAEQRATFILRLWRETTSPPGEWRGEVEYVQAARSARFADLSAMLKSIELQLAQLELEDMGSGSVCLSRDGMG